MGAPVGASRRVAGLGLSLALLAATVGAVAWGVTALLMPGRTTLPVPVLVACTAPWAVAVLGLAVAALASLAGSAVRSARRRRA